MDSRNVPGRLHLKSNGVFGRFYFLTPLPASGAPGGKLEMYEINKKVTWLRNKINPNVDVNENQTSWRKVKGHKRSGEARICQERPRRGPGEAQEKPGGRGPEGTDRPTDLEGNVIKPIGFSCTNVRGNHSTRARRRGGGWCDLGVDFCVFRVFFPPT